MKLGMGTHQESSAPRELKRLRHAIIEGLQLGIQSFDTAHNYGEGAAETLLGEVLADRPKELEINTKIGFVDAPSTLATPLI